MRSGAASAPPSQESLGRLLKRAEQTLLRAKSAALKTTGLTLAQYVALAELDERPGITGAELARACLVSPQAMMVVLKTLEEQGLVERTPHTRHQTVLEIYATDAGREVLVEARERVEPIERTVNKAFSPSETATLGALLQRLTEAVSTEITRAQ